jgi:hypothetical protein
MTSLNLSSNGLGAEGAKHIVEGIKVNKCVVAVILAPSSYPSDHWLNCCCLLISTQDNGAISKFIFSGDESWSTPVTMETTMTEADFSNKTLGVSGGMLVAAFLPKCQ